MYLHTIELRQILGEKNARRLLKSIQKKEILKNDIQYAW